MKIAVVTGASSGIGRELVKLLNRQEDGLEEIWVIARRQGKLEELQQSSTLPLQVLALDLTKPEALTAYAKALAAQQPQVLWLANCSGFAKLGDYTRVDLSQSLQMLDLNCRALTAITMSTLPFMRQGGHIIQIASSAGFFPLPDMSVYAATKAYVLSYARSLNAELKPRGISVTAVTPGPVKTEFWQVAEATSPLPVLSRFPLMADSAAVAAKALRDAERGKDSSTYGITTKAHKLFSKLLPHSWLIAAWQHLKNVGK